MWVERGNMKIANIFQKKSKTKNKDCFDVGKEDKCENCKKIEKKNKESFDVGRENKCENCKKN